jgi:hypothetical protein
MLGNSDPALQPVGLYDFLRMRLTAHWPAHPIENEISIADGVLWQLVGGPFQYDKRWAVVIQLDFI